MASRMGFDIFARDVGAKRTFDDVGDSAERLGRRVKGVDSQTSSLGSSFSSLGGSASGLGSRFSSLGGSASGLGSRLGSLGGITSGLRSSMLSVGTQMASVGTQVLSMGATVVTSAAKLSAFAIAASSAASQVSGLAVALAPAVGAVAALPGVLALGAGAMLTLKVALSGVGDAFGAALSGTAKQFETALAKLSPAAQSVARELHGLKGPLDDIKNAVQDSLFAPLQGQLTDLVATLGGPVRDGMAGVAQQFGLAGQQAAVFARSADSVAAVQKIFADLRQAVADVRPALEPLLAGFRDLAVVGSGFAAGLAPGLAGLITRFGEFLSKAAGSGQALQWMNNAMLVFQQLGGIAKDVGGILKSVFTAMKSSGVDSLGIIGQLADKLNAFFSSAKGQNDLAAIFRALNDVGAQFGPILRAVGDAAALLAPKIAEIAIAFGPALVAVIRALAPGVAALAPGLVIVGEALRKAFASPEVKAALVSLGKGLSDLIVVLSPVIGVLASALSTIAPLAVKVAVALGPILTAAIGALGPAVAALAPGLTTVATALASAFSNPQVAAGLLSLGTGISNMLIAVAPLIAPLIELAGILIERFGNSLTMIATFLQPVTSALAGILLPILPQLAQLFRDVSAALLPFAQQLGGELGRALTDLGVALTPLIKQLGSEFGAVLKDAGTFLRPVIDALREVGGNVLHALLDVLPQVTPHIGDLVRAFAGLFVEVVKILPSLIRFGGEILVALIQQLPVLVPMAVDLAKAFLEIVKAVTPLIPPLLKLLLEVVLPLIPELPKLLPPFIQLAWIVADLFTKYSPLIKKLLESPEALAAVKSLASNGVLALNTLRDGLNLALGAAQTFIGIIFGMPDQVNAGMSRMGNAIKDWLNHVIDWIERMMNNLASIIPGMPQVHLPRLADGGIINRPTAAVVGEAGPEVVIPLTKPARALQLVQQSGLMDMLASATASSSAGLASMRTSMASALGVGGRSASVVVQGGDLHLHFAGQPLLGRDEIARVVMQALADARSRGFNVQGAVVGA